MKEEFERLQRIIANTKKLATSPELERLFFKKYKTDGATFRFQFFPGIIDCFTELAKVLQAYASARGVELVSSDDVTSASVTERKRTTLQQDFDTLFSMLKELRADIEAVKNSDLITSELEKCEQNTSNVLVKFSVESCAGTLQYLEDYLQEIAQKRLRHE